MQQFEHFVLYSKNKDGTRGLGRKPTKVKVSSHAIIAYDIDLFEDAPFECLFVETQSPHSKNFIMGSVMPAPLKLKDGVQAKVDDLIKVNMGLEGDFHLTFISARLSSEEQA